MPSAEQYQCLKKRPAVGRASKYPQPPASARSGRYSHRSASTSSSKSGEEDTPNAIHGYLEAARAFAHAESDLMPMQTDLEAQQLVGVI